MAVILPQLCSQLFLCLHSRAWTHPGEDHFELQTLICCDIASIWLLLFSSCTSAFFPMIKARFNDLFFRVPSSSFPCQEATFLCGRGSLETCVGVGQNSRGLGFRVVLVFSLSLWDVTHFVNSSNLHCLVESTNSCMLQILGTRKFLLLKLRHATAVIVLRNLKKFSEELCLPHTFGRELYFRRTSLWQSIL